MASASPAPDHSPHTDELELSSYLPDLEIGDLSPGTLKEVIPALLKRIPNPYDIHLRVDFLDDAGLREIIDCEKYHQALGELIQYVLLDATKTDAAREGIYLTFSLYDDIVDINVSYSRGGEEISGRKLRLELEEELNERFEKLDVLLNMREELSIELGSRGSSENKTLEGKTHLTFSFETKPTTEISLTFGESSVAIKPGATIQSVLDELASDQLIASTDQVMALRLRELGQEEGRERIIVRADFDLPINDSYIIDVAHIQPRTSFPKETQALLDSPLPELSQSLQKRIQKILAFQSYEIEDCIRYVKRIPKKDREQIARALVHISCDDSIEKSPDQLNNLRAALITLGEHCVPYLIEALEDEIMNGCIESEYPDDHRRLPSEKAGFLANVIKNSGDKRGSVVLARALLSLDWSEMIGDQSNDDDAIHIRSDETSYNNDSEIETHALREFSGEVMAPALYLGYHAEDHGSSTTLGQSKSRAWHLYELINIDELSGDICNSLVDEWASAVEMAGNKVRSYSRAIRSKSQAEADRINNAETKARGFAYLINHQFSRFRPFILDGIRKHLSPRFLEGCYYNIDKNSPDFRRPYEAALDLLTQEERVDPFFNPLFKGEMKLDDIPKQIFEEINAADYRREELVDFLHKRLKVCGDEEKISILEVASTLSEKSFLPHMRAVLSGDNYDSLYSTLKEFSGERALIDLHQVVSELSQSNYDPEMAAEVSKIRAFFVEKVCDWAEDLPNEGRTIDSSKSITAYELSIFKEEVRSFVSEEDQPLDSDQLETGDAIRLRAISLFPLEDSFLPVIQRIFSENKRREGWYYSITGALAGTPPSDERDNFFLEIIGHYESHRSVEFNKWGDLPREYDRSVVDGGMGVFSRNRSPENLALLKRIAAEAKSYEVLSETLPQIYRYGPEAYIETFNDNIDLNLLITGRDPLLGVNDKRIEEFSKHPSLRDFFVTRLTSSLAVRHAAIRPTKWGTGSGQRSFIPVASLLRDILFSEMDLPIPKKRNQTIYPEMMLSESPGETFKKILGKKMGFDLKAYEEATPTSSRSVPHALNYLLERDKAYYSALGTHVGKALELLRENGFFEDSKGPATRDEVQKLITRTK